MHDENANAREMTRTPAATTTATLSAFTMHYTSEWNQDFDKNGETWEKATWPTSVDNSTPIDFYAHDGGTFVWNNGNPYVNFIMDENAFTQKDFLVATHKQISYKQSSGVVPLTFDHACAAVQFKVFKEGSDEITVNSIILKGVKKTGDYFYNESTKWQNLGTTTNYTLTNGDITVTTDKQLLPCKWLFIIPQSKVGISIEVNYNTNQQKIINLTDTKTWVAGKQYTISIRM
jgi:hypothetical protein